MKKLLIPAMGAAAALGLAQPAAAQFFLPGQPGVTGSVNRTVPPGSPGISPLNTPTAPSPFTVAPSPSFAQPSPFIGQRGDLNAAEPETAGPAERDANGKLNPSVDRTRARLAGERGPYGKLLPTYGTEQAQASPPTPSRADMPNATTPSSSSTQPGATQRRPGSGAMSGQSAQNQPTQKRMQTDHQRSGAMGSGRGHNEEYTTAALNALSAQGFSNFGRMERVGNIYQTTATKDGRQMTVQGDPETGRGTQRLSPMTAGGAVRRVGAAFVLVFLQGVKAAQERLCPGPGLVYKRPPCRPC